MPKEGYPEDFGGEADLDVRGGERRDFDASAAEGGKFHVGQEVFVAGMQGEYVIKAFLPESNDVYLATSMDAEDEDMIKVAVDRLVEK